MGEFEYDVRQRSRIAHSAARRKGRGGGKKCTLPSDYLTPAQWRRKNGPVIIVQARTLRDGQTPPDHTQEILRRKRAAEERGMANGVHEAE